MGWQAGQRGREVLVQLRSESSMAMSLGPLRGFKSSSPVANFLLWSQQNGNEEGRREEGVGTDPALMSVTEPVVANWTE